MSSSSWIGNQHLRYLVLLKYILLLGRVYAPVRGKNVVCEVAIGLCKLGIIRAGNGGNGGRYYKFFEKGGLFFFWYEV